jgi:catalase
MEDLFNSWKERNSPIATSTTKRVKNDDIDKNSKTLLTSILCKNMQYQKKEIPLNYRFDETSKSFEPVDITKEMMASYITNKSLLDDM